MAKRRSSTSAIVRAIPVRAPAPIIRVSAPRPSGGGKKRRRSSSKGSGGGLNQKNLIGSAIGGAVYGFVEKSFPNLPTVPILGRAGTVAIVAYFLGKGRSHGIVRDVGLAAAVIAGYQLGSQGRVLGEIVPQVSGVAAQV